MARHRRPQSPARSTRPSAARRVVLPTATLVTAGFVTVGTAFACTGPSATASAPQDTGRGVTAAAAQSVDTIAASPADAGAIAEAVRTSPFTAEVAPDSYEVTGTRLASSDPTWAVTELRPVVADLDRAEGVLHRTDQGWVLVQLGSYEVGCGIAPDAVLDDLDLECAPQDGSVYPA